MVTRKDLIIAVLATSCLTATLLTMIPTKSSTAGYDPWLDYNDDGIVNILDISAMALAFQSTGDSTKNVNVTNWPDCKFHVKHCYDSNRFEGELNTGEHSFPIYDVPAHGFRKFYLWIWTNDTATEYVWIGIRFGIIVKGVTDYNIPSNRYPDFQFYGPGTGKTGRNVYEFDVIGDYIQLAIGGSNSPVTFYVDWYLTA